LTKPDTDVTPISCGDPFITCRYPVSAPAGGVQLRPIVVSPGVATRADGGEGSVVVVICAAGPADKPLKASTKKV
jgi:hypothetical protein